MLKKMFTILLFVLSISILCGCSDECCYCKQIPADNGVVRYPVYGETDDEDYARYYNSALMPPNQQIITDTELIDSSREVTVNGKKYLASYNTSQLYSYPNQNFNFLNLSNYDEYVVDGKVDLQVFKGTGFIKKLYIYADELTDAVPIVSDFSEAGLKNTAIMVLTDLYGSSISDYLETYYQFEYAKLIEYANAEQNRYVVCYRAYLNQIPTDDVVYIQFSLDGALMSVSAQRYLQYFCVDLASLADISILDSTFTTALTEFGYTSFSLRDKEPPCYYTANAAGELYYVTEWNACKMSADGTGVTHVEVLALSAQSYYAPLPDFPVK